ncbi:uncharacterized protein BT62DRAFT_936776, partial [Guyanagaster necrorhizus]
MRTPFLLARTGGLGSISSWGKIPVHYVTSLTASVHDSKESVRTISSSQIANLIFKAGLWCTTVSHTSHLQPEAKIS